MKVGGLYLQEICLFHQCCHIYLHETVSNIVLFLSIYRIFGDVIFLIANIDNFVFFFFQTNIPRCLLPLWILSKTWILFHWYLVWLVGTGTIPCLAWVLGTVLSHPYRWFCPCLWAVSSHALTDLNSKDYQEWPSADLQCSFSVRFISFQYSVLKLHPLGLFRPSASSFHLREPSKFHLDSYLPINHLETLLRQ